MNSELINCIKAGRQQSGVVLVAVVVFLLIATLLIASASTLMERRLNAAQQAQDNYYLTARLYAKINEITYMLATQRLTVAGISAGEAPRRFLKNEDGYYISLQTGDELRVDSYIYNDNGINFNIQNMAGLLAINSKDQTWLNFFLNKQGVDDLSRKKLLDTLHDYADENDIQRPIGMESSADYQTRNYLLQACAELWRVAHWQTYLTSNDYLSKQCNLGRTPQININAVPIELWAQLFPTTDGKLKDMRAGGQWFASENEAALLAPSILGLSDDYYSTLGGNQFIVRAFSSTISVQRQLSVGRGLLPPIKRR